MAKAPHSKKERVAKNPLCKLLIEYQNGIRQYAKRLIQQYEQDSQFNCMDSLSEKRDDFKDQMRKASGTAEGWAQAVSEVLTIELLKEGLKKRVGGKWAPPDEDRLYWSGMVKKKELRIRPRVKQGSFRPDVTITLEGRIVAIVETKSSFEGPREIQEWVSRLHDTVKGLRPPARPLVAIVCYGHHWKGGRVRALRRPDNLCFVCASHLVRFQKSNPVVPSSEILGFEPCDVPNLVDAIGRMFH